MTPTEAINTLYHDDLGVHQIDDWEFYTCAFDPFSTSFIKHAEKAIQDGRGKRHTENVLLPLLTDLFHLFLSDGVTSHLSNKVKITPLHKKSPNTSPKNYRLLAINGCILRLFANVVRDMLTDWALAEHQIPDSQFGFCPTRNTNQPLFILRHILATAKKKKMKVFTAFLDLLAAYDSNTREKLWRHLQKIDTTIFERYHPNHVHRMPLPSY